MTFARITTVAGTVVGTIERRTWRWLYVREDDGDLCEVAVRHVVSIETGAAIEEGYRRAVKRFEEAKAGPKPALADDEIEALMRRVREAADVD